MKSTTTLRLLVGTAAIAALTCGTAALAETSTAADASAAIDAGAAEQSQSTNSAAGTVVSDVVVTALRREQNIQSVPASITALGAQQIESQHIESVSDLVTRVPSLTVGTTFGSTAIAIRGVRTSQTSGFEDASVAVHVDGVYQPRTRNLDLALADLERIEVLAGPQGTLYGRNATGGVINYIQRGPTKDFEGEITAKAANYERYGVRGYVSGPLGENVQFRLSGLVDNQDQGYVKNLLAGAPDSSFLFNKVWGVRGVLRIEPASNFKIDLEANYTHNDGSIVYSVVAGPLNPALVSVLVPKIFDPRKVYVNSPTFNNSRSYNFTGTATWDIAQGIVLKSITGYQHYENAFQQDSDATGANFHITGTSPSSHTVSEELDLNVSSMDNKLASIFGLYYFDDHVNVPAFAAFPTQNSTFVFSNSLVSRSYAAFTDQTYSVTDKLRLSAGIRFNDDKKDTLTTATRTTAAGTVTTCGAAPVEQEFKAWTPRAGVQYDVTDGVMAYGNYQKGYKSGGVGANTCANSYLPETIKGGEAGFKSTFADHRVRLNVAGYYYDYANLQVSKQLGNIGGFIVQNAAAARIKGVEVTLTANATERFHVDVSGVVQSVKFTNYFNCNTADFPGACGAGDTRPLTDPTRNQNLAGRDIGSAAPYTVNVGAEYLFNVLDGTLLLRGESYWSGKIMDPFRQAPMTQKPYNVQNAYLTYTPNNSKFQVRAFVKNIGDVNYFTSTTSATFMATETVYGAIYNPPRTYGVEASYKF